MRRVAIILAGVVAFLLLLGPAPAAAYSDSGTDPQGDSAGPDGAYDISFSSRSVFEWQHRRSLRIKVRTYERDFWSGSYLFIDAKLDARGGREADAILHLWILDQSGSGCALLSRAGRLLKAGRFRITGNPDYDEFSNGVFCRVRVFRLHPTKAIRWKVRVLQPDSGPTWDKAPNEGMVS
jgi:hypothetical protein